MAGWCANTSHSTTNASFAALSNVSPTPAHATTTAAYRPRLSTAGLSCSSPVASLVGAGTGLVNDAARASRNTACTS